MNAEQASKETMLSRPTIRVGKAAVDAWEGAKRVSVNRGSGKGMYARGRCEQHGKPRALVKNQPDAREGQAGVHGVAEKAVVLEKPGNAGGGKGLQFKRKVRRNRKPGD